MFAARRHDETSEPIMDFRIQCSCGLAITVSEAAAGGEVRCACGQTVRIPQWSELRVRAGLPPYNISPELLIENLLIKGELTFDNKCVKCEETTDHLVQVLTKCEKVWVKETGSGSWTSVLALIVFGWWGGILMALQRQEDKTYGRDKTYWLPLRICPACEQTLRTPQDIKLCLRAVPTYDLLLDKFPDAEVSLGSA
jgi:hypothetical protein